MKEGRRHTEAGVKNMLGYLDEQPGLNSVTLATFNDRLTFQCEFEAPSAVRFSLSPSGPAALHVSVVSVAIEFLGKIAQLPERAKPAHVQVIVIATGLDSSTADVRHSTSQTFQAVQLLKNKASWDFRAFKATPDSRLFGPDLGFDDSETNPLLTNSLSLP